MNNRPQIAIRPATLLDCETITEFNIRLALETEEKALHPETIAAGVRNLLTQETRGRYFVACSDDRIIGQVMHTREWSDWRNGEIWWLQSVFVHPDFRRLGVFKDLYHHLEELAKKTPGVIGIRLYAEENNTRALRAYASLGLSRAGYLVLEQFFENVV